MKMNTIIKEENRDKIRKALDEVQQRATARCIGVRDIEDAVSILEARFEGVPASRMKGVTADIDMNARTFPSSYFGRPESTHFTVVRTGAGWKITDISRDYCKGPTMAFCVTLTDEAERALIESRQMFRAS